MAGIMLTGLSACSSISYLWQAGRGQLELLNRSRPVADVLKDERTPPKLKDLLSEVALAKSFGELHGLKPTPNYANYIALDRAYVVWVVTASEELNFKAKVWSFPVVGSFNYLGWFSEEAAVSHAKELSQGGWDTDVRGASAYSTLGWFKDPILSTMIQRGRSWADTDLEQARADLVNVVLHESVHATVYVKDQSPFNESLANFAADRLTRSYFEKSGNQAAAKAFESSEVWAETRRKRMHAAYEELHSLYSSNIPAEDKRQKKKAILEALQVELKVNRPITNATLIQYKTYQTGQADFEALFQRCGGKWDAFWRAVGGLKSESFPKTQTEDFVPVVQRLGCGV